MKTLNIDKHSQLVELIEDSIEYWCDEHMASGELAWIVIQCLATAKIAQMRGEVK